MLFEAFQPPNKSVTRSAQNFDFFIFHCSLRPESSQELLPTSIAGVLRLRAIKPSVCDSSAKRFAQDDGFVAGLKYSWLDMQTLRDSMSRWWFSNPLSP
jgi:hypothetical protein